MFPVGVRLARYAREIHPRRWDKMCALGTFGQAKSSAIRRSRLLQPLASLSFPSGATVTPITDYTMDERSVRQVAAFSYKHLRCRPVYLAGISAGGRARLC